MPEQILREVNAPYTVNPDDQTIGHETVIIRRNGEPVAAVVPYAEYQGLLTLKPQPLQPPMTVPVDPEFEKQYAAFQRLLPELLKAHRGEWVGIVNEQAVAFGANRSLVLRDIAQRLGHVPMCVQEVRESPRVYKLESPRILRGADKIAEPVWEKATVSTSSLANSG